MFSAADHVTGTYIQGNSISNNYYGIGPNTDTSGISNNTFTNVNGADLCRALSARAT